MAQCTPPEISYWIFWSSLFKSITVLTSLFANIWLGQHKANGSFGLGSRLCKCPPIYTHENGGFKLFPILLKVKQGCCEYQFLYSLVLIQPGIEPEFVYSLSSRRSIVELSCLLPISLPNGFPSIDIKILKQISGYPNLLQLRLTYFSGN